MSFINNTCKKINFEKIEQETSYIYEILKEEKIEGLEDIDNELAEFIITNNNYNDIKLFIYEQQLSIQTHDMITGCEYEVVGEFDCYEYHVYEEAYDIKADVLINFTSEERITNRRMVKELGSDNYKEKIESETMVHAIGIKII